MSGEMDTHGFEYEFKGERWGINIAAATEDEARLRLIQCALHGGYMGIRRGWIQLVWDNSHKPEMTTNPQPAIGSAPEPPVLPETTDQPPIDKK